MYSVPVVIVVDIVIALKVNWQDEHLLIIGCHVEEWAYFIIIALYHLLPTPNSVS